MIPSVILTVALLFASSTTVVWAQQNENHGKVLTEKIYEEILAAAQNSEDTGTERAVTEPSQQDKIKDPSFELLSGDARFNRSLERLYQATSQANSGQPDPRIFYGLAIASLPNVVSLFGNIVGNQDDNFLCTGVLITKNIVLTAAHCLCSGPVPVEIRSVKFQFGAKGSPTVSRRVSAIGAAPRAGVGIPHFCPALPYNVYQAADLAVLKLEGGAPCTGSSNKKRSCEALKPARLGTDENVELEQGDLPTHYVVGYGLVDPETAATFLPEKGAVALPSERFAGGVSVASVRCNGSTDQQTYGCVRDQEIVAGQFKGLRRVDACNGDSGGPLFSGSIDVLKSGTSNPDNPVVGIVSRGFGGALESKECGSGTLYARMSTRNRSWIAGCINALENGKACTPISNN